MSSQNSNIAFTHANMAKLLKVREKSSLSNIILLSAMPLTSEQHVVNNELITKYATDAEGIDILRIKSGDLVGGIQDSIQALSIIMSEVDEQEHGGELHSLHWLICGLSELAQHINDEQGFLSPGIPLINNKQEAVK